ncbi:MAG: sugar phosphate isomerase/epimerase [Phycisphaeraceae bacterium]|nr:MAG: sugar phosphate isomerase/epimerase [Phycisphaeraceae bacterium]
MNRIAVCSWSLRPESPAHLVELCARAGVTRVQVWLDPVRERRWAPDEVGSLFRASNITLVSGMFAPAGEDYSTLDSIKATGGVRPDATWEGNQRAAEADAILAARYGLPLVTFHAGFITEDHHDPERGVILERLRALAMVFAARNVRVAFESGQETAANLADALDRLDEALPEHARVGVNFDPANMILYGSGDPIAALERLMPRVRQVHVKDAVPSASRGEWGEEKPAGQGAVDWARFFGVLKDRGYAGDFVIERESGVARVDDIRRAKDLILSHLG